ncbi:MAG: leucine-rich repeat domain-containing protein [Muribaculaceae bacterium]|nr:leucine-rich repeat domain-containing protein [Muribaculaceae bacterium]
MNYIKLKMLVICLITLMAGSISASAESVTYDLNIYEINPDTEKATLVSWLKSTNEYYEIPAYIQHEGKTYPVTAIGEGVLARGKGILVIPPTIEECEGFGMCTFSEVHISDISAYCMIKFGRQHSPFFYDNFGRWNKTKLVVNGEVVTDLVLPDDATYISPYAFHSCGSIINVIAPNVEEIGEMAFHMCPNLRNIYLGSAIRVLGDYSLGCSEDPKNGLTGFAPSYVYIMAPRAPKMSLSRVEVYAIPRTTTIRYSENFREAWKAFSNSNSAYHVECVDDQPYYSDFTKNWYEQREPYTKFVREDDLLYRVDQKNEQAWLTYAYSTATKAMISPQVTFDSKQYPLTKIQPFSLAHAKKITGASIPEGISEVGESMFQNCTELAEVQLPATIRNIEYCAFDGCTSLSRIDLPDNIEEIQHWAFRNSGLTEVNYHNKNTKLGVGIFYNCKNLKTASFTTAGALPENTFAACSALETLTLGEGVTELPGYSFKGCDAFTDLYLPTSITKVEGAILGDTGAFKQPNPLNVHITDLKAFLNMEVVTSRASEVGVVDYNLFGKGGLLYVNEKPVEDLVLEPGVSVRDNIFKGCGSIKSLVMGDVDDPNAPSASIGERAFAGCPNLKSAKIAVDKIGSEIIRGTTLELLQLGKKPCTFDEDPFIKCRIDEVRIPSGDIPQFTFNTGKEFKKIILGEDVTSVGSGCFGDVDVLYLYRYAGEPTKLDKYFAYPKEVHVPIGRKYAAPEGAPYSGCYLDEITASQVRIAEDKIIEDLPNPLYAGVEDIEVDDVDPIVTVYNLQGVEVYHGVRSQISLPNGIYLEKSSSTTRKISI